VATNQAYSVTFKKQFGEQRFQLYVSGKKDLPDTPIHFNWAENPANTIRDLKAEYLRVLNSPQADIQEVIGEGKFVTADDIQVTRDTSYTGTGTRYLVELVGQLAGKSVPTLRMSSEKLSYSFISTQAGSSHTDETQRVDIAHRGSGTFTLSLNHEDQTYTTDALELGASEQQVQAAFNRVLGDVGSVTVTAPAEGSYLVVFGGALAGQNLDALPWSPPAIRPASSRPNSKASAAWVPAMRSTCKRPRAQQISMRRSNSTAWSTPLKVWAST
jgi:hypothetical protein